MRNHRQPWRQETHGIRLVATVVFCSLALVVTPNPVIGQCVEGCEAIHILTGEAPGDQFGWESPSIGDVDQDGFNDFVITSPTNDAGGNNAGRAYVYSGASGVELFRVTGSTAGAQLGFNSNPAGDVGVTDGIPDLILGAPFAGAGRAFVYSGVAGALMHTFSGALAGDRFGYRTSGAVDVNGDGRSDLLVSAINHDAGGANSGRVYAYSGVNFSLICTIDGLSGGDLFGTALNGVGDLNNDQREEFVVGARHAGAGSVGRAYVISYDGVNCSRMFTLAPTTTASDFGYFFAAGGGDVNNDGTPDVYVGDFSSNRAYVYSGADGAPLLTLSGDNNGGFGIGEIIGDVNGDGHSDLFLAAWVSNNGGAGAGKAFVYSGADGLLLETFTHDVPGANFGFDAKRLGDVNSDGRIDHLVTAANHAGIGRAYVIAGTVASMPEDVRLLVTGWSSNNAVAYDAGTGSGIGTFVTVGSPHSIRKGPDGNYYVTSVATNQVLRFNPAGGFAFAVFVNPAGTPLNTPTDAVFGPDGNLYVASFGNGLVLRFDGQSGAFMDTFATGPGGGRTEMLEWGSDGHLYVTTGQGHSVIRFHGVTGLPLPGPLGAAGSAEFVPAGSGSLNDPHSLIFGPDGHLYVSSMDNPRVVKFDGATGALLDVLAIDDPGTGVDESGGLSSPHGMSFGPNGDLFVCSFGSNNILRFDKVTGDFIEVFATGTGLLQPTHLLFEQSPADFDEDFDVDQDDADVMIGCFDGPGNEVTPSCLVADFDQDTDVDCGDWENFKRAWTVSPAFPPFLATCDPDCNSNLQADEFDLIEESSPDCNINAVPDECDIADETSDDNNSNGVPDECDSQVPLAALAPHDIRKNRFVSFDPNNTAVPVALRVDLLDLTCTDTGKPCAGDFECTACVGGSANGDGCSFAADCPGGSCVLSGATCVEQTPPIPLGWVGDPVVDPGDAPAGTFTSSVVNAMPAFRVWAEPVIHLSDCEIAPVRTYGITATANGASFSESLVVSTIAKPEGKFWADVVGSFDGSVWSAPNTLVNVDDVSAVLKFLSLKPAPHITVLDLAGSAPTFTNFIINASDLGLILQGFTGKEYPPPPYLVEGYPPDGDVTNCP